MLIWPAKDPLEELDFSWTVPLDSGDTLDATNGFFPTVVEGTIVKDQDTFNDTVGTVWLRGGIDGEIAKVEMIALSEDGRKFREIGVLPIVDHARAILADFRMMYSAFVSIPDGDIGFWLAKAAADVGTTWPSDRRDEARCAWAAHKMVENGVLQALIPAGVTGFRSGDFSAQIDARTANRTGYDSTKYGLEFKRLQRLAFGGSTASAWTPPAPC